METTEKEIPESDGRSVVSQISNIGQRAKLMWRITRVSAAGEVTQHVVIQDNSTGQIMKEIRLSEGESFEGDVTFNAEGSVMAVPVTSSAGYRIRLFETSGQFREFPETSNFSEITKMLWPVN